MSHFFEICTHTPNINIYMNLVNKILFSFLYCSISVCYYVIKIIDNIIDLLIFYV